MVFDIVVAVLVLGFGFLGYQSGALAQIWQLVIYIVAGAVGRFVSRPAAGLLVKGIDWPPGFATGVTFTVVFGITAVVGWFVLAKAIESAKQHDGSAAIQLGGSVFGAVNAILLVYLIMCGATLMTQHLGATKKAFAFKYYKSKVGKIVLTKNMVDPEPFPQARVLRALIDAPDPSDPEPGNPFALGGLKGEQCAGAIPPCAAMFLWETPELQEAIRAGRWKQVRRDPRMLALVCDHAFLAAARDFTIVPKNKKDIGDKYKDEMDGKRRE